MDRISNNMSGQLRTYEAYRAQNTTTEKNTVSEEEVQKDQRVDSVQFSRKVLQHLRNHYLLVPRVLKSRRSVMNIMFCSRIRRMPSEQSKTDTLTSVEKSIL